MKKIMMTLIVLLSVAATGKAMSYEQARNEALFLTDKMAYELNLTDEQYEAAYEINLDYLMGVTSYDDVYGDYWERRNRDLSYVMWDWQWTAFCAAAYFFRPLTWVDGYWHFGVYARYPHRDFFYFGRPVFYATYRGGHAWHHHGTHGYYYGHRDHFRPAGQSHFGMHDRWNRGDFRHHGGHNSGNRGNYGNHGNHGNHGGGSFGGGNHGNHGGFSGNHGNHGNYGNHGGNRGGGTRFGSTSRPEVGRSTSSGRSIGTQSATRDRGFASGGVRESSTRTTVNHGSFGGSHSGGSFGGSHSGGSFGGGRPQGGGSSHGGGSFGGGRHGGGGGQGGRSFGSRR